MNEIIVYFISIGHWIYPIQITTDPTVQQPEVLHSLTEPVLIYHATIDPFSSVQQFMLQLILHIVEGKRSVELYE